MNLLSKISLVMAAAMLSASFSPAQTQDPENGTASSKKYAVVNFSVNFMREQPEYEAELGDQALMGTVVEIVGKKDYWKQIVSPEPYKAWVNDMGLVEMDGDQLDQIHCCTQIYMYCRIFSCVCTS
jgi:SH3-like domain-containing protein